MALKSKANDEHGRYAPRYVKPKSKGTVDLCFGSLTAGIQEIVVQVEGSPANHLIAAHLSQTKRKRSRESCHGKEGMIQ